MSVQVFNYYQDSYMPAGPLADANLYAPEAMLLTAPFIVNWLNTATSLIRNGLVDCDFGFSIHVEGQKPCIKIQDWTNTKKWVPQTESGASPLIYTPSSNSATTVEIVSELDLLLTAGRLNARSLRIIESAYDKEKAAYGDLPALMLAQQLLITTPEFHTSAKNDLVAARSSARGTRTRDPLQYKAIVFFYLGGGCDSFSMLLPYDGCEGEDRYEQYVAARGAWGGTSALQKSKILPIDAPEKSLGSKQACSRYAVNPNMPYIKKLYDEEDALFFANTGVMTEAGVDRHNFVRERGRLPKALFGHNTMTRYTQNLDANNFDNNLGVIGRMMDNLQGQGASTASYSVDAGRNADSLTPRNSTPYDVISHDGVTKLGEYTNRSIGAPVQELTSQVSASPLAETWASQLRSSIVRTDALEEVLANAPPLKQAFKAESMESKIGKSAKQVAKLISINKDKHERNAFHIKLGGFDAHNSFEETGYRLAYVDKALESFEQEMKLQGVWDQVVVVPASDFGRTVQSNGRGTDHAWGG